MIEFIQQHFTMFGMILFVIGCTWHLIVLDKENQVLKEDNDFLNERFKAIYEENIKLKALNSHLKLENPYIKK